MATNYLTAPYNVALVAFTYLPLRRTVPVGVAAYLLGYLVTVAATFGRVSTVVSVRIAGTYESSSTLGEILGTAPSVWTVGGWLFYNAHLVPTSVPTADSLHGMAGLASRNLLLAVSDGLLLLPLVPLVVLPAAGYLVVRLGATHVIHGGVKTGASVAVGYVPLFLLGAFLLTAPAADSRAVANPHGILTVFVGLVYVPVLGALGGYLAELRTEPVSEASNSGDSVERS